MKSFSLSIEFFGFLDTAFLFLLLSAQAQIKGTILQSLMVIAATFSTFAAVIAFIRDYRAGQGQEP